VQQERLFRAKQVANNLSLPECDALFELISLDLAGDPLEDRWECYAPLLKENELNQKDLVDLRALQIALIGRRAQLVKEKFEKSGEDSDFR
jgi:hypothetical protein